MGRGPSRGPRRQVSSRGSIPMLSVKSAFREIGSPGPPKYRPFFGPIIFNRKQLKSRSSHPPPGGLEPRIVHRWSPHVFHLSRPREECIKHSLFQLVLFPFLVTVLLSLPVLEAVRHVAWWCLQQLPRCRQCGGGTLFCGRRSQARSWGSTVGMSGFGRESERGDVD